MPGAVMSLFYTGLLPRKHDHSQTAHDLHPAISRSDTILSSTHGCPIQNIQPLPAAVVPHRIDQQPWTEVGREAFGRVARYGTLAVWNAPPTDAFDR